MGLLDCLGKFLAKAPYTVDTMSSDLANKERNSRQGVPQAPSLPLPPARRPANTTYSPYNLPPPPSIVNVASASGHADPKHSLIYQEFTEEVASDSYGGEIPEGAKITITEVIPKSNGSFEIKYNSNIHGRLETLPNPMWHAYKNENGKSIDDIISSLRKK